MGRKRGRGVMPKGYTKARLKIGGGIGSTAEWLQLGRLELRENYKKICILRS